MPAVYEAIDKMTASEKVSMMEYLWNALTAHYVAETPEWHGDVLSARRQKIERGEAEFMSLEESEMALEKECHAR